MTGYGKRLLDKSMEMAKKMGAGALAITGNIDFYGKSGFVPAKTKGVRYSDDPEAEYFLIKELIPGFLNGIPEHTRIRKDILSVRKIRKRLSSLRVRSRKSRR